MKLFENTISDKIGSGLFLGGAIIVLISCLISIWSKDVANTLVIIGGIPFAFGGLTGHILKEYSKL